MRERRKQNKNKNRKKYIASSKTFSNLFANDNWRKWIPIFVAIIFVDGWQINTSQACLKVKIETQEMVRLTMPNSSFANLSNFHSFTDTTFTLTLRLFFFFVYRSNILSITVNISRRDISVERYNISINGVYSGKFMWHFTLSSLWINMKALTNPIQISYFY